MIDLLARLRAFSLEPGALFIPVTTRTRGQVPVWAVDIRAADDDAALLELVYRCAGGKDEVPTV